MEKYVWNKTSSIVPKLRVITSLETTNPLKEWKRLMKNLATDMLVNDQT